MIPGSTAHSHPPQATLSEPGGVIYDAHGNVFFCDTGAHSVRTVAATGEVRTLAGNGKAGYADGKGSAAAFCYPCAADSNRLSAALLSHLAV